MERSPLELLCINAASMAADIAGDVCKPLDMEYYDQASFQAFYTGSGVGVLHFAVSNRRDAVDKVTGVPDLTKFTTIPNPLDFADQDANGAKASGWYPLADLACAWLLCFWTRTSGTGSLTVYAVAR